MDVGFLEGWLVDNELVGDWERDESLPVGREVDFGFLGVRDEEMRKCSLVASTMPSSMSSNDSPDKITLPSLQSTFLAQSQIPIALLRNGVEDR